MLVRSLHFGPLVVVLDDEEHIRRRPSKLAFPFARRLERASVESDSSDVAYPLSLSYSLSPQLSRPPLWPRMKAGCARARASSSMTPAVVLAVAVGRERTKRLSFALQ